MSDASTESFRQLWAASDHARHAGRVPSGITPFEQILLQKNYELGVLVSTLVDLLAEAGVVDGNVLMARVDGLLETEVQAAPAVAKPATPMTRCAACGTEVPMQKAEMTARGLVCGPCSLRG